VADIQLVVFDIGGTTMVDNGQVPRAFEEVVRRHGIAMAPAEVAQWRGASKREAVAHFVRRHYGADDAQNAARMTQIYGDFKDHLRHTFAAEGVQAIAGAAETFAWLHARHIQCALTSGFDRDIVQLILEALHWDQGVIDATVSGDEVRQGRPAPYMIFRAMEQCGVLPVQAVANAGDTVLDMQSGRNAGVALNVAVLSGAHARDKLAASPHTHILDSVADLPRIIVPGA
jgi:phosphonatase-like hydrolase